MITDQDKQIWDAIVAESRRRTRRRRRLVALPAVVAVVATGAGVVATRPDHQPRPTHVATGPSSTVAGAGLQSLSGDTIPSLASRFALPPCPDAAAELAVWATEALAPWTTVPSLTPQPMPLRDVAASVPVPAVQPTPGSCATGIALGGVLAWEEHNPGGAVVGRGGGVAAPSRTVPSRLTSQRTLYHQEFVASGQLFSGVVGGGHIDGLTNGSAVVLDVPGVSADVASGGDAYGPGLTVLSRLTFATVAPASAELAFKLPTAAPPGFARCTADVAFLRHASGTQVDYCNAEDATITVSWPDVGPNPDTPPATASSVDVNGVRAGVYTLAGSRVLLRIRSSDLWQAATLALDIEGPAPVGLDQLAATLRSIPTLDPRVLRPRGGTHDLRPVAMDNARLGAALTAAGAADVTFPDCPPPAAAPPTTVHCGAAPVPSIRLTVPPGSPAALVMRILTDTERPEAPPLFGPTGMATVAGVDVVERQLSGPALPPNSAQQAYFLCGRVAFNFVGNDVLAFVERLIPTLGC